MENCIIFLVPISINIFIFLWSGTSGLECSRVDEFCKDVKSKTNCIEIYKENCSQQKQETNMGILLQNYTKSLSEVNIFSPVASISSYALYFNATFVYLNYSNTKNESLRLGVSIENENFTLLSMKLEIERKVNKSLGCKIESCILRYDLSDGNKDKKLTAHNVIYIPHSKKKSWCSLTISFKIHMNLLQKKLNVIGNLIDMNQTKVIDHSATVGLTKSFVTDRKTPGKENFYLVISKPMKSSTQHIEIENVLQTTDNTGYNKNGFNGPSNLKPVFNETFLSLSEIKLESLRHLKMMKEGVQWSLKKEKKKVYRKGNRTWFQRLAPTKDLQRKGKALNIDITSVNGTQYNNVLNDIELKTTTKMSTPDSYGKFRTVDYTSIWIGFGAWLVIVTTAVVFVGYKIYQCGIQNLREKEDIDLRLTNAALLTSISHLERRRSSGDNKREKLKKIAIKHRNND